MDESIDIGENIDCALLITGAYNSSGGIAALNRLVIKALLDGGYQVKAFVLNEPIGVDAPLSIGRVNLQYITFAGNKIKFVATIWLALLKQKFTIALVDHVNLASILAPWALLKQQQYYVWLCGVEVFPPRPDSEGKIGLHWAKHCLAISDYTRLSVIERYPNKSIFTCELALDPETSLFDMPGETVERKPGTSMESVDGSVQPLGDRIVLHVGRMESTERYKGQDTLIRAFPQISERFPEAQLVLAGDGDDRQYLLDIARSLPATLQAQIFLPGFVEDDLLINLYDQCYLFAMPSSGEGFGIVFLEAMLHAKPCLGGRVDASPYLIQEDVTGLIVDDPNSANEVAEKVCWIFARPTEAARMGRAGYERVRSNYLFSHFKERFLNAIAE